MKFSKTFSISLIKPFSFYFLRKKIFKLKRTKWKQLRKHIRFIVKCRKYQKKNRKFKFYKIKKLKRIKNKKNKFIINTLRKVKKNKSILRKTFFSTIKICPGPKGRMMYHRHYYKNLINHKKRVMRYFNSSFSLFYLKNFLFTTMAYKNSIKNAFIFLEYRLENLLVKLKFFESKEIAKINIAKNNILVNFQKFYPKGYLKSGDIITFKNNISFLNTYLKYLKHYYHCPFAEIDYYSNSIVIIYSLKELNSNYLNIILRDKLNIFLFKKYFNIK